MTFFFKNGSPFLLTYQKKKMNPLMLGHIDDLNAISLLGDNLNDAPGLVGKLICWLFWQFKDNLEACSAV